MSHVSKNRFWEVPEVSTIGIDSSSKSKNSISRSKKWLYESSISKKSIIEIEKMTLWVMFRKKDVKRVHKTRQYAAHTNRNLKYQFKIEKMTLWVIDFKKLISRGSRCRPRGRIQTRNWKKGSKPHPGRRPLIFISLIPPKVPRLHLGNREWIGKCLGGT